MDCKCSLKLWCRKQCTVVTDITQNNIPLQNGMGRQATFVQAGLYIKNVVKTYTLVVLVFLCNSLHLRYAVRSVTTNSLM